MTAYLQPAQDITVGGRIARAAFQYTLQDPNIAELNEWAGKMLGKMRTLPEVVDVGTDLLVQRAAAQGQPAHWVYRSTRWCITSAARTNWWSPHCGGPLRLSEASKGRGGSRYLTFSTAELQRRWWRWINRSPEHLALVRTGLEAATLDATGQRPAR